jgi:hypothetical protein
VTETVSLDGEKPEREGGRFMNVGHVAAALAGVLVHLRAVPERIGPMH